VAGIFQYLPRLQKNEALFSQKEPPFFQNEALFSEKEPRFFEGVF
jgi:hypothetical protein